MTRTAVEPSHPAPAAPTRGVETTPLAAGKRDLRLSHLRRMTAEWMAELKACVDDAEVETVHRVRTGTRRLEATIEVVLRQQSSARPPSKALDLAAQTWTEQLAKIRRAAGPVRDLDVHRQLLERFAGVGKRGKTQREHGIQSQVEQLSATPAGEQILENQAEELDAWLMHARQHRAGILVRQIEKRLPGLEVAAAAFEDALASEPAPVAPIENAAAAALAEFARLAEEMPLLDAANLHEFRKRAKKARYITESGGKEAHAEMVGKAIKRVQDVIGDWHDWLSLASEARLALGTEGAELETMLGREVERTFQQARRTTERMRGRLVGEWRALPKSRPSRRRTRPKAAEALPASEVSIDEKSDA